MGYGVSSNLKGKEGDDIEAGLKFTALERGCL